MEEKTYERKQNEYYAILCRKYGEPHDWERLNEKEKGHMRFLRREARKEYFEAIQLK